MGQRAEASVGRTGTGYITFSIELSGEFLAGAPAVELGWAKGLTAAGRPILSDIVKISAAGVARDPAATAGRIGETRPTFRRGMDIVPAAESSSVFTKLPADRVTRGSKGLFVGRGWTQIEPSIREILALDAATGQRRWKYVSSPSGREYSGLLETWETWCLDARLGPVSRCTRKPGALRWAVPAHPPRSRSR